MGNCQITLPDTPVTVCERSDGSGTTFVFTQHLSAISPEFKDKVGKGTTVTWPVGVAGKGRPRRVGDPARTPLSAESYGDPSLESGVRVIAKVRGSRRDEVTREARHGGRQDSHTIPTHCLPQVAGVGDCRTIFADCLGARARQAPETFCSGGT